MMVLLTLWPVKIKWLVCSDRSQERSIPIEEHYKMGLAKKFACNASKGVKCPLEAFVF
jgi:hypothetical protein